MIKLRLQFTLVVALLLMGCTEGGGISLRPNGGANISQVETEIRNMSQRELDLCRLQLDSQRSTFDSFSSSDNSFSSGNTGGSVSRQSDADAWQSAVDVQNRLFGPDLPADNAAPSSSGSGAGFAEVREGIAGIDVLRRDNPSQYSIALSQSSSSLATLYTRGVARVTTNVAGNRPRVEVQDSAEVNLTYNLSNIRGRWQCNSFTAEVLRPLTDSPRSFGDAGGDDGRIGW